MILWAIDLAAVIQTEQLRPDSFCQGSVIVIVTLVIINLK